jgi:PAS domain S-box-containing protein
MARTKSLSKKGDTLRSRPEKLLAKKGKSPPEKLPQDAQRLIHELRVHQVELETQNEELRRAQLELEESRDKYAELYDFAPTGYFTLDQRGRIVEVNLPGACQLGVERGFLRNKPFSRFVSPEFRNLFHSHLRQVFTTGAKETCELNLRKKDGSSFYASMTGIVVKDPGRKITECRCTIMDITERKEKEEPGRSRDALEIRLQERTAKLSKANEESQAEITQRKRAEESIRQSEKQLRQLSNQLLMAQEAERKRIAGELHDSIGQSLAATRFTLERKIGQMDKGKAPPGILLEDILLMIQNSIMENRRIMTNLRPSMLDDLGIITTIHWFCREFQKTYPQIKIEKRIDIREEEVLDHLKIVIFRVLQEAMNNSVKYGKGDLVSFVLRKMEGAIEFKIQDNGRGFDPGSVQKGLGLVSMEERVRHSGGSFSVESSAGKGATIQAIWPL